MDPAKLDQLRHILADAATAHIRACDLVSECEAMIAGEGSPEAERTAVEIILWRWLDEWGPGEDASALGVADVTAILEEIEEEARDRHEEMVRENQEDRGFA